MDQSITERLGRTPLQKLNHRHQAFINWLIMNPDKYLWQATLDLGYSRDYIYAVHCSDAFQAAYRERCAELGELVIHTQKDKLAMATGLALERTAEKLSEGGFTEDFLTKTTATLMKANGLGNESNLTARHMHLHTHVDADTLMRAREKAAKVHNGASPQKLEDKTERISTDNRQDLLDEDRSPSKLFAASEG